MFISTLPSVRRPIRLRRGRGAHRAEREHSLQGRRGGQPALAAIHVPSFRAATSAPRPGSAEMTRH
eukprot:1304036-Alexandrium_andersonii.AAC.1